MNKVQTPPIAFGGVQSIPDYRDIPLSAVLGVPSKLPNRYHAPTDNLPIWDQKRIGSCVGHATGKKKQTQEFIEMQGMVPINPRFGYALAKAEDGLPIEGTYYRLGVKMLEKYGAPPEIPEYKNDCDLTHAEYVNLARIPQKAYDLAKQYKIKSYAFVGGKEITEEQLMQAIVQSDGVLMGVQLGREWWTDKSGVWSFKQQDILPLRPPAAAASGHAIFVDGYEVVGDSRLRITFINSWGKEWGSEGRGWFYFDEYQPFITEAWSAIDLPNDWLEKVKKLPSADTFRHSFNYDFALGLRGEEVTALQTALMIDGEFSQELYIQILSEEQLGYYGQITKKAVRDFQFKYKVASLAELLLVNGRRVGEKTRKKLNELFAPKI